MKAMPAGQYLYDDSKLEDTEFALAISPCPQVEGAGDVRKSAQAAPKRGGLQRSRQLQTPRQTRFREDDLIETLTLGWAIALAIAVALVVHTSGG